MIRPNHNMPPDSQRVVVTGLGVVSSLGIGWQDFWDNLLAGKSGISEIEGFDTSPYECKRGGEVKIFDPEQFIPRRKLKQYGRASQFAIAAAQLSLRDGELDIKAVDPRRVAVCIGSTMGEPQEMEEADAIALAEADLLKYDTYSTIRYPAANISQNVAHYFHINGRNYMFTTACAAGNYSITHGADMIRLGKCDYALCGGADALSRMAFTGFGRLFAMSKDVCRPFDKERKGMMLAEGGGILLLESLAGARARGARIYAEVSGAGFSCDAKHMTNPSPEGVSKAIGKAMPTWADYRGLVGFFCAHGTGTVENDRAESMAVKMSIDGGLQRTYISSIKSALGHAMGAASAIESVACCLALTYNKLPPTINFSTPDEECDVDLVATATDAPDLALAFNNSQAFGGNNSCLTLKAWRNSE